MNKYMNFKVWFSILLGILFGYLFQGSCLKDIRL